MAPNIETMKAGLHYGSTSDKLYLAAREEVVDYKKKAAARISELESVQEIVEQLNPNYHYLFGKVYDLRKFYDKHPGGKSILQMSAGLVDATPLFESYHAFANRPAILKQLEKYRVKDESEPCPEAMYSFEEDGFYRTLTRRVREHFGATKDNQSVAKNVKANWTWVITLSVQVSLTVFFYYQAFLNHNLSTPVAMLCASLGGMFFIQAGFVGMHSASHFAVLEKNHWLNEFITRVWCAFALWNGKTWESHHIIYHHSYTGHHEIDPDIHHSLPFACKHPESAEELAIFRWIGDSMPGLTGWGISAALLYVFLPGMWLGQVLMYFAYRVKAPFFARYHRLWGMPEFSTIKGYDTKWYEYVVYASQIGLNVYRGNLFVSWALLVSLNFFYSCCIVADHDLVESAVLNHVDVTNPKIDNASEPEEEMSSTSGKVDWGEVQVRNSTDFVNDEFNLFASLHGSINYQIEHHLFPGINDRHLPVIAPIVQKTCKEFGIPYTTYPRMVDAWTSFLIVLRAVMTGRPIEQDIKEMKMKRE